MPLRTVVDRDVSEMCCILFYPVFTLVGDSTGPFLGTIAL